MLCLILPHSLGENGSVIGLSKLNRIVEHFGRRGAIQEQLTSAIPSGSR
jgi:GTP cyclohydrolase I